MLTLSISCRFVLISAKAFINSVVRVAGCAGDGVVAAAVVGDAVVVVRVAGCAGDSVVVAVAVVDAVVVAQEVKLV